MISYCLDGPQDSLGIEAVEQHQIGAEQGGAVGVGERAGVVERGAHQVGAVGPVAEALTQHEHPAAADVARRRTLGRLAAHALRSAGRARRVEHRGADDRLLEIVAGQRVDVGPRAEAVDGTAHREAAVGGHEIGRGGGQVGEAGLDDEDVGLAVLHDVGDLVGRPPPRHGGEAATRPRGAPVGGQVLRHVPREHGHTAPPGHLGGVEHAARTGCRPRRCPHCSRRPPRRHPRACAAGGTSEARRSSARSSAMSSRPCGSL